MAQQNRSRSPTPEEELLESEGLPTLEGILAIAEKYIPQEETQSEGAEARPEWHDDRRVQMVKWRRYTWQVSTVLDGQVMTIREELANPDKLDQDCVKRNKVYVEKILSCAQVARKMFEKALPYDHLSIMPSACAPQWTNQQHGLRLIKINTDKAKKLLNCEEMPNELDEKDIHYPWKPGTDNSEV
ncbi:hypothetical protein DM02DRAFT_633996 [Periconia macrospinosa]|uniref:Uncharacterized protein n=1 Tax=Periconia macrospinosa TaxID=97972 RepID=A0A2V1DA97_9PLEO|nr:hypothetical protein DM02DRAFT_633996 [Periconia macrospinosa]